MKKWTLGLIGLLITCQSFALSTEEFITVFVNAMNQRLSKVNAQREAAGQTPYCSRLSQKQVNYLAGLFLEGYSTQDQRPLFVGLDRVEVLGFVNTTADGLYCYPMACPSQGRASLFGAICNTKSFNMDLALVRGTLNDLAGRELQNYERLSVLHK